MAGLLSILDEVTAGGLCCKCVRHPNPSGFLLAGLLCILDEVTAGGLIVPAGEALAPAVAAVEWAEAGSGSEEDIPESAWQLLGVPAHGSQLVKATVCRIR